MGLHITPAISLIQDRGESAYRWEADQLAQWSDRNRLEFSPIKRRRLTSENTLEVLHHFLFLELSIQKTYRSRVRQKAQITSLQTPHTLDTNRSSFHFQQHSIIGLKFCCSFPKALHLVKERFHSRRFPTSNIHSMSRCSTQ